VGCDNHSPRQRRARHRRGHSRTGGGDRPVGTVDEDANPPMSDPTESETYGGTGELTPQDTGSAMPPYEGRKEAGARVAVPT
jgi:hypothetical protein